MPEMLDAKFVGESLLQLLRPGVQFPLHDAYGRISDGGIPKGAGSGTAHGVTGFLRFDPDRRIHARNDSCRSLPDHRPARTRRDGGSLSGRRFEAGTAGGLEISSCKTRRGCKNLGAKAMLFWYRQSPRPIEGDFINDIAQDNPPLQFPGEILVTMDTLGRLVSFPAVPPQAQSPGAVGHTPDWAAFFGGVGLDFAQWTPSVPQWNPILYADVRAAWQGRIPDRPEPVQIEAAAFRGRVVGFEIIGPWSKVKPVETAQQSTGMIFLFIGCVLLILVLAAGACYFARMNLRLGRGDRRNATRLAAIVLLLTFLNTGLIAHIIFAMQMIRPLAIVSGLSLLAAASSWILYMAIEPFLRRKWPQVLISWNRLISGNWRDPSVARDIFLGCAFGILNGAIYSCLLFVLVRLGYVQVWIPSALTAFMGARFFAGNVLGTLTLSILVYLGLMLFLSFLWLVFRNHKIVIAVAILIGALATTNQSSNAAFLACGFTAGLAMWAVGFFVLIRFGLLSAVVVLFTAIFFSASGITLDTSAWYFGYGFAALAIFAAIVLYAFRTSLAGRPLFAPSRLDD